MSGGLVAAVPWYPLHFVPGSALVSALPEVIVGVGMVLMLVADLLVPPSRRSLLAVGAAAVLASALGAVVWQWAGAANAQATFSGSFAADRFGLFADGLILCTAIAVVMLSPRYLEDRGLHAGEYYILLLASVVGMMTLAGGTNLIVIFLGVELLSIPLYVLAGFARDERRSQEAAVKYLLLGGFASAFLLYGMALVYGDTGQTNLAAIHHVLLKTVPAGHVGPLLIVGIGLIGVGLAFKVSAVPFQWWTPDVYEGSPMVVTTFMSVATKVAAFAAFLRVFSTTFGAAQSDWTVPVALVAIASMIFGNVVALAQHSAKRMLAYSGIAQAGYILIGVALGQPDGTAAALYYLAAYTVMNTGAFGILTVLSRGGRECDDYRDLSGLGRREPLMAGLLSVFLLSLAGFPLTVGFFGKFFLFSAAIHDGQVPLAVWGVLTSAVSVFYYLRITVLMFARPAEGAWAGGAGVVSADEGQVGAVSRQAVSGRAVLLVAGDATLVLGVFPTVVYGIIQSIHVVIG